MVPDSNRAISILLNGQSQPCRHFVSYFIIPRQFIFVYRETRSLSFPLPRRLFPYICWLENKDARRDQRPRLCFLSFLAWPCVQVFASYCKRFTGLDPTSFAPSYTSLTCPIDVLFCLIRSDLSNRFADRMNPRAVPQPFVLPIFTHVCGTMRILGRKTCPHNILGDILLRIFTWAWTPLFCSRSQLKYSSSRLLGCRSILVHLFAKWHDRFLK